MVLTMGMRGQAISAHLTEKVQPFTPSHHPEGHLMLPPTTMSTSELGKGQQKNKLCTRDESKAAKLIPER